MIWSGSGAEADRPVESAAFVFERTYMRGQCSPLFWRLSSRGIFKLVAICVIVAAAATLPANGIEPIERPAQAFFCGGSRAAGNRERWRPSLRCISEQARPWQHEGLRTSGRAILRGRRSLEALGVIARLPIEREVSTCGLDFDDDTSVPARRRSQPNPASAVRP